MKVLEAIAADIRFGLRTLGRDRSFTAAVLIIFSLGIAANTTVFSLVNGVLLRPLAYADPGRLVAIHELVHYGNQLETMQVNVRHFSAWRRDCRAFQDIALIDETELNLSGDAEPERVRAARVTPNYFDVLGINPPAGRAFSGDDGQPGRPSVAVISYSLWQRRYGGDSGIIGKSIDINGVSRTVIGVLPTWFRPPAWKLVGRDLTGVEEVFLPWAIREDEWGMLGDFNYYAIGRLAPGYNVLEARSELDIIQDQIAASLRGDEQVELKAQVYGLQAIVTREARSGLLLLLASVAVLLVIVCVNLAGLMLGRALGRGRDGAIRAALGASRWRILQSNLIESGLLGLGGAALGLGLAVVAVRVLVKIAPPGLPRLQDVGVDYRVLLFMLGVALACAIGFGIGPALRQTRSDPNEALRSGGRGSTDTGARQRLQSGLVAAETGLSVTLLVVAGLLVASFVRLMRVDRGFETHNVLTAQVNLASAVYKDPARREQFYNDLIRSLEDQPGIEAAGVVSVLPLNGERWNDIITVEGDTRPIMQRPSGAYRPVTPDYFRAMGISLISGRAAAESDRPRLVVVVSERTAQTLWPGQDPIGKTFTRAYGPPHEVIGVAAGIRDKALEQDPGMIIYVPLWERVPTTASIAIRTRAVRGSSQVQSSRDPGSGVQSSGFTLQSSLWLTTGPAGDTGAAARALHDAVRALDPGLPVSDIQTMEEIEQGSLSQRSFQMLLIALFAGSALLLSAVGTYSVLASAVARRTNEIGIRMALGASRSAVMSMVLARGLRPVVIGIAVGIAGALVIGRFISGMLYAVSPYDIGTMTAVVVLTTAAALLACLLPARRAITIDPITALRYE
jgi:putative ABC transport system permease protein